MRISKYHTLLIAAFVVILGSADASANKFKEIWHKIAVGHHRNNAWPEPFVEADAIQVNAPFEIQKRNGWRLNNTIGHELFRDADSGMKVAGQQKIGWIATQAPQSHREIHVLRGNSEEETRKRVASVREALAFYGPSAESVNVYVTNVPPPTYNGAWATSVNREWMENLPAPKLPSTSAAGTAGSTQQ